MADARDAAGATDPDPGCSGPADTSEDSEVGLPAGCTIELATFNGDEQFPGIAVAGCGAIKGAWFKPSAAPIDCHYAIGAAASATCTVTGATAGATFAATSQEVLLAMHTTTFPQCGPVDGGDHARRRQGGVNARRLVLMRRVGWRDAGPAGPGCVGRAACRAV